MVGRIYLRVPPAVGVTGISRQLRRGGRPRAGPVANQQHDSDEIARRSQPSRTAHASGNQTPKNDRFRRRNCHQLSCRPLPACGKVVAASTQSISLSHEFAAHYIRTNRPVCGKRCDGPVPGLDLPVERSFNCFPDPDIHDCRNQQCNPDCSELSE